MRHDESDKQTRAAAGDSGEGQESAVTPVTPVTSVIIPPADLAIGAPDDGQPLRHPLWVPELQAQSDPFHEEREDLLPIDRDEADLLRAPERLPEEEPDWFRQLPWPGEDEPQGEQWPEDDVPPWEEANRA